METLLLESYDFIIEYWDFLESQGVYTRYLNPQTHDTEWVCNRCESVISDSPIEHECEEYL